MLITLIAAIGQNRELGFEGKMPWHCPEDLRHFKALTLHKPVVMGRKTYESIGKPLPDRRNVIISRNMNYDAPCEVVHSLAAAMVILAAYEEVMIIGGAQLYQQALPMADRLHLTEIQQSFEADTFFPAFDHHQWKEVSSEAGVSAKGGLAFRFITLERC
jgi:dihydrofolate reductase